MPAPFQTNSVRLRETLTDKVADRLQSLSARYRMAPPTGRLLSREWDT